MGASAVLDIQNSWGAAFIGVIFSAMLYGMTIAQTWFYFFHYRNRDPIVLRGFIVSLFALDTVHTILCIYAVYWYLVLNFGNVESLGISVWAMNYQIDISGVIGFMVQLFYARRVYIMGNSIVFPLIIAGFGTISLGLAFLISVKTATFKANTPWRSLTWITCVGMGSAASADILIVLSMCWCLYHKRTGFSKTDSMIMTLMAYSINTGLLTSLLSIATIVSFAAAPTGLISLAFFWPLGKCYVNSFLAMLNNRDHLRERSSRDNNSGNTFSLSSVRHSNARFMSKTGPTAVAVTVHRSATSDFTGGKHDYDNELNTLELVTDSEKAVTTSSVHEGLSDSAV